MKRIVCFTFLIGLLLLTGCQSPPPPSFQVQPQQPPQQPIQPPQQPIQQQPIQLQPQQPIQQQPIQPPQQPIQQQPIQQQPIQLQPQQSLQLQPQQPIQLQQAPIQQIIVAPVIYSRNYMLGYWDGYYGRWASWRYSKFDYRQGYETGNTDRLLGIHRFVSLEK